MFLEHVVYLNANSRRWGRDEEEEEEGVGERKLITMEGKKCGLLAGLSKC